MSKILSFAFIAFTLVWEGKLPQGWAQVEKSNIKNNKVEVYFFDYMTRLSDLEPDFPKAKGREQTDMMRKVEFRFPTYMAELTKRNTDSVYYFLLRPNQLKAETPNWYDLITVGYPKKVSLSTFEDSSSYQANIISIDNAVGCRGSVVYEHSVIIQKSSQKDQLIGNGIQIAEGIFTRVVPYAEVKASLFRLIEGKL